MEFDWAIFLVSALFMLGFVHLEAIETLNKHDRVIVFIAQLKRSMHLLESHELSFENITSGTLANGTRLLEL